MENQKVAVKLVKKESKSGKSYFSLIADFGYREQIIEPYDSAKIISLLDCPLSLLYDLTKDCDSVVVAYLDFNIDKE